MTESIRARMLRAFENWYDGLRIEGKTGLPARGTMAASLVVLDKLKEDYKLDLEDHRAPGGSQVSGASGAAVRRILAEFGETRMFLSEGGRTNRGALSEVGSLLQALKDANLSPLPPDTRNHFLTELQRMLVGKVDLYHRQQRLSLAYNPTIPTRRLIEFLLATARENGKDGPVAQYLVGAKLQIRFPEISVRNVSHSTADTQLGEPGDFRVGDTAFHVTIAPLPPVFDKCKVNLDEGLRAYVLVPDRTLDAARQNADGIVEGRVGVESVESFVAQNLDELGCFSVQGSRDQMRRLLTTYNERVDLVETDKSMLIELPQVLL